MTTYTRPELLNTAPDANGDPVNAKVGETIIVRPLENDRDADGDTLTITKIAGIDMQPGWTTWVEGTGLVTLMADNSLKIQMDPSVTEKSWFDYTISDGRGGTDTSTVDVDIVQPDNSGNTAPVANADPVAAKVGETIIVRPLDNDTDADGDPLTITQIEGVDMQPGWSTWVDGTGLVTLMADNSLKIQMDPNVTEQSWFGYTVSDGKGGTASSSVDVEIVHPDNSDNTAPVANADPVTAKVGETITVRPLDNDTDADGDALTITQIEGVDMQPGWSTWVEGTGLVTLNADNSLTVKMDPNVTEQSWFGYTVSDGKGGTASSSVDVEIEQAPAKDDLNFSVKFVGTHWDNIEPTQEGYITEGQKQYFRVFTDEPVTEDVTVTLTLHSGTGTIYGDNQEQYDATLLDWTPEGGFDEAYGAYETRTFTIKAGTNYSVEDAYLVAFNDGIEEPTETLKFEFSDVQGAEHYNVATTEQIIEIRDNNSEIDVYTPIALDLNGDGQIGVTGETSSYQKDADAELGRTVEFDIDADGELETIEWFDGSGDGILVDLTKIGEDGSIDGSALFGDEGGQYENGYVKLAGHDANGDGEISGTELEGLGLWIDDGDAILEAGELQTVQEAGVTSVSAQAEIVLDDEGRELIQSQAQVNGETVLTEDVWFAEASEEDLAAAEEVSFTPVDDYLAA